MMTAKNLFAALALAALAACAGPGNNFVGPGPAAPTPGPLPTPTPPVQCTVIIGPAALVDPAPSQVNVSRSIGRIVVAGLIGANVSGINVTMVGGPAIATGPLTVATPPPGFTGSPYASVTIPMLAPSTQYRVWEYVPEGCLNTTFTFVVGTFTTGP